jgi:hypothetical protein
MESIVMAKSPDRPMNSIDIDVGGTFTDLVLTLGMASGRSRNAQPRRMISRSVS